MTPIKNLNAEELEKKYPYTKAENLGVCRKCNETVAISPDHNGLNLTLNECRMLFIPLGVCQTCLIKQHPKVSSLFLRRPW